MKDVKIGKLIFTPKAILLIALWMFINGLIIGAYAVLNNQINFMFLFTVLLVAFFILIKQIKKYIKEIK
ncbi:hypothetical protein [Chishuiella sp.]|uniref:hypothetical protein n=1 Tax=Chishuiella sp. TaxID=1969467 RepID=UPI0028A87D6F|nr:hypothetical protein [Chishuiella sp.]